MGRLGTRTGGCQELKVRIQGKSLGFRVENRLFKGAGFRVEGLRVQGVINQGPKPYALNGNLDFGFKIRGEMLDFLPGDSFNPRTSLLNGILLPNSSVGFPGNPAPSQTLLPKQP